MLNLQFLSTENENELAGILEEQNSVDETKHVTEAADTRPTTQN